MSDDPAPYRPRLAFSTNAFKKHTLPQAIDAIADAGYGGVELMADLHHAHPPTFDAARRRDTAKRLGDLGLAVSNVNAFTHFADGDTYRPTWIDPDPSRVDLRVRHTIACVELAAEFGARTVSLQPGGPLIGTGLPADEAAKRFADALGRCVEAARSHGVTLAIEPEPGLLIESAAEYVAFKRAYFAGESAVRMNCDVGHLFCVGDDPARVIRELPDEVAHVHLEDIGPDRVHQHLTPGRGVVDFVGIFAALRDANYAGPVTVELYPYETTAAGVARLALDHLRGLGLAG